MNPFEKIPRLQGKASVLNPILDRFRDNSKAIIWFYLVLGFIFLSLSRSCTQQEHGSSSRYHSPELQERQDVPQKKTPVLDI